MKRRKPPEARHVGINVTPMIDLIMCLIIFFLLAARLGDEDRHRAVVLPRITAVHRIDEADRLAERVTVNFVRNDRVTDPGGPEVRLVIRGRPVTRDRFAEQVAVAAAEHGTRFRLFLRPDKGVTYRYIQEVLDIAGKARVDHVRMAAEPSDPLARR